MTQSLNQVTIDLAALRHNYRVCAGQAKGVPVLAMVKGDSYGHGMIPCSRELARIGVHAFGVAEAVDGVRLRQAEIEQDIFVMAGVIGDTVDAMVEHRLTPVLVDDTVAEQLSQQSLRRGVVTPVHLKLDAGMGRQGVLPAHLPMVLSRLAALPGICLKGILAHFPAADVEGASSTPRMLATFQATVASVRPLLPADVCLHIANSAGLLYVDGAVNDMVRPGIALYGYYPDGPAGRAKAVGKQLRPVMRFTTRILQVRQVPADTGLGYGHLYTTRRPTILAVLSVGYEDGYLRCLSNRAVVLVRGRRAPVVGRISMNLTLVDVTDIDGVAAGEEVVLLGSQGEEQILADEIAGWMETISYEVLCLFGGLNHRIYQG